MSKAEKPIENKKILILKRAKHSLIGAEKYLIKREWEVFSTDDLKTAVLKAMEWKPEYIFIAFDHSNSKATNLPKVFRQVLTATTIPFVETQSSYAQYAMKREGSQYILIPPIIGTKIERLIYKIKLDKEHANDPNVQKSKAQFQAAKTGGGEEMVIEVKGLSGEMLIGPGQRSPAALGLDSSDSSDLHIGKMFDSATGSYQTEEDFSQFLTAEPIEKLQAMYEDFPRAVGESEEVFRKKLMLHISKQNEKNERISAEASFFDEVYGRAAELSLELDPNQAEPQVTMEILATAMKDLLTQSPESLLPKDHETPESYERRMTNLMIAHLKKRKMQVKDLDENFKMHFRGALEVSSFKTLQDLQQTSQVQEVVHILSKTKQAQCFLIQGKGFKGYLIAASGSMQMNSKTDEAGYYRLIESKLKDYLKETEAEVDISDQIQIQFHEVDFKSWSIERADFIHKAVSDGEEIALAYFSVDHPDLILKESKAAEMSAVSIEEFVGEVPVEFDLFIHFPANNRYIRYTKDGFILYEKQRKRLDKRGIQEMHVQKTDIPELKKYRVQNYFNNIIQDFKKSKGKS